MNQLEGAASKNITVKNGAVGALSSDALAVGALGALAVGSAAFGALAIGRLVIPD